MGRRSRCLLACTVAFGTVAATSEAATVEVRSRGGGEVVHYVAGPGERNDLAFSDIEESWPAAVLVEDPGAVVTAATGCVSLDPHRAVCISGGGAMYHYRVELGDGDDLLHPAGFNLMNANGGPGDDRLLGGTWSDRLNGGGGRDELRGGADSDVLLDGDGAVPDADVLDGGEGVDWVSFEDRATAVAVDLARAGPTVGEGDILLGLENVHGGRGDDVLSGDAGPNVFDDEGGRNIVNGRGGDDRVRSRSGPVDCGAGRDEVRGVTPRTRLAADCERVIRFQYESTFWSDVQPRPTANGLVFRIFCTDYYDGIGQDCSGAATVREAGGRKRLLAVAAITPGSYLRIVRLKITPLGARLLARRDRAATLRLRGEAIPRLAWGIVLERRAA